MSVHTRIQVPRGVHTQSGIFAPLSVDGHIPVSLITVTLTVLSQLTLYIQWRIQDFSERGA